MTKQEIFAANEEWAQGIGMGFAQKRRWINKRFLSSLDVKNTSLICMWNCCCRYDPSISSFRTFAHPRIIGGIIDYVRMQSFWGDSRSRREPPCSLSKSALIDDGKKYFSIIDNADMAYCLIKRLKKQQRDVIYLRYLLGLTQKNTGKIIGLTEPRVNQIESKALESLRRFAWRYANG